VCALLLLSLLLGLVHVQLEKEKTELALMQRSERREGSPSLRTGVGMVVIEVVVGSRNGGGSSSSTQQK